jgi:hypothetical protein
MPEEPNPAPESPTNPAQPEPVPEKPKDTDIGEFITRHVLEKDAVFFEG